jgi:hypothetical protein
MHRYIYTSTHTCIHTYIRICIDDVDSDGAGGSEEEDSDPTPPQQAKERCLKGVNIGGKLDGVELVDRTIVGMFIWIYMETYMYMYVDMCIYVYIHIFAQMHLLYEMYKYTFI